MCTINKNHLLDYSSGELSRRDRKKIENHISHCSGCREYLLLLSRTRNRLLQLPEEQPRTDTLDLIMINIEHPEKKPAEIRPAANLFPTLWIPLTAVLLLAFMFLVKDNLPRLAFWNSIESLWIVQQLGLFGTTVVIFVLTGILITLLTTPILIFESQNKSYGFTK